VAKIIGSSGLAERQFEPYRDLEILPARGLLRQDTVVAKEPQTVE
jgi:hypothetical protein